jgi:ornithine cyclodeaminase
MAQGDLTILGASEVQTLLEGQEDLVMQAVREAYEAHARGQTSLPHSTFLRFPDDTSNRIIALPAYLGGRVEVAGMKWIASFPGNIARGIERASAIVVLNSMDTGRPEAVLEGSVISAQRTAASAALAAHALHGDHAASALGLIGCGVINAEVARFVRRCFPSLRQLWLFDLDPKRAAAFARSVTGCLPDIAARPCDRLEEVLERCPLVSFATTALQPHVLDVRALADRSTVLHVSLRDLAPEVILACDNVVDDADHVCRAETSIHLAERRAGHRGFIRCTLGDVLLGHRRSRGDAPCTVFSPFGLGILDLAVGHLVLARARASGNGRTVAAFSDIPPRYTAPGRVQPAGASGGEDGHSR